MMKDHWTIVAFTSFDQKSKIRAAIHNPSSGLCKQSLVIVLGRNEWLEKYTTLLDWFPVPENSKILLVEHRSQGKSGGIPAYIKSYDEYSKDLEIAIHTFLDQKLPYSMIAHSMGALITLHGIIKGRVKPQSMLFCAPLLKLSDEHMPLWLLRITTTALKLIGLGKLRIPTDKHEKITFDNNKLTHDKAHYEYITSSPLRQTFTTVSWIHATQKAMRYVFKIKNIKTIKTPTTIIYGGSERVVDPRGFLEWFELAKKHSQSKVQIHKIENAKHELLAESITFRPIIKNQINSWLSELP